MTGECPLVNRRLFDDGEWIEIPGATPAIISEELFEAAQTQLQLNKEKSKQNTKQRYLLRGHLYCRQCGHSYCGHVDRTIRYYHCPGKLRDELLDQEIFTTLEEAKILTEQWRKRYNQLRPHSAIYYRPPAPEAILTMVTR